MTTARFGIPMVFVLIWSTGFIVAKAVLPHAELQMFLVARFSLTAATIGGVAVMAGAQWPDARRAAPHILAGALMQGAYLCASYWSITHGMPAGITALLGALQPLFTALYTVGIMGKTLQVRAWLGLCIGFGGVALVLAPKLAAAKRIYGWPPASKAWVPPWSPPSSRPMWMMRSGDATKVTALLLLVPPLAAVQAYLFFRETLAPVQFVGFALALTGVLLTRSARSAT